MGGLEGELGRVAGSEKAVGSDSCQRMGAVRDDRPSGGV